MKFLAGISSSDYALGVSYFLLVLSVWLLNALRLFVCPRGWWAGLGCFFAWWAGFGFLFALIEANLFFF